MAGVMGRIPVAHRILVSSMNGVEFSGDGVEFSGDAASLVDMMFGFYQEGDGSPESCSTEDYDEDDEHDHDHDHAAADSSNDAENKAFWEAQHIHLQGTLGRSGSLESRIRRATKDALRETKLAGAFCNCQRPVIGGGCQSCLMTVISEQLRNAGFNSAICHAKWRSSPDIPSGEHTYIDVVDKSDAKRGEVRVVIELNLRAEFEMARASEDYNRLINRLPEIFVGKAERLRTVIKIICAAAKKCMKERKMHMGPWRKHKYMLAKWFGTCKRTTPTPLLPEGVLANRLQRPRASMLTFDLLDNLPSLHCTAVKVL